MPVDLAAERHHAVANGNVNPIIRDCDIPSKNVDRLGSDLVILRRHLSWQTNFHVLRNGSNAFDTLNGLNDSNLFRVAGHMPGESDDAIVDRNTDMRRIDARLELQFVVEMLLQLEITFNHRRPRRRHGLRRPQIGQHTCRRRAYIGKTASFGKRVSTTGSADRTPKRMRLLAT